MLLFLVVQVFKIAAYAVRKLGGLGFELKSRVVSNLIQYIQKKKIRVTQTTKSVQFPSKLQQCNNGNINKPSLR